MERFFKSSIVTSTLLAALGILLIFESEVTIATISYVIGAVLVAAGTFAFLRYLKTNQKGIEVSELDILYGIVTIIIGVLVIKNPQVIASIIPLILGIAIVISSASKLQYSFDLKSANNDLWKTTMAIACVSAVFGMVLIFNPFAGAVLLMRIVGIFILIYAILDVFSTIIIKKNVSEFNTYVAPVKKESVVEAEVVSERVEVASVNEQTEKKDNSVSEKKVEVPKKKVTTTKEKTTTQKKPASAKKTSTKKSTSTKTTASKTASKKTSTSKKSMTSKKETK